jgi:nucleotide-binding universal stress UspA family protein
VTVRMRVTRVQPGATGRVWSALRPTVCYRTFTTRDTRGDVYGLASERKRGRRSLIKNILVPLDGSALSESALPYARAVAKRAAATLTLVRAAQRPARPLGDPAIDAQRAIMETEAYVDSLRSRLVDRGFNVQTGVASGGSIADGIIEEIGVRCPDLVVMASRDRRGPDRWAHGSVAEAVVNRGGAPVMLIRPGGLKADAIAEPHPVLIVTLDGSELAEEALPFASNLVSLLAAQVVLLSVVPTPGQLIVAERAVGLHDDADLARLKAEASVYLEATIGRVSHRAASAETLVRVGEPSTEIAAVARERAAAAVIMATHGRTGMVRSILGSVAGAVLHRAPSPVVLIRPRD